MKKALITGVSGYFGTLAKHYLQESGIEVLSAGRGVTADIQFDLDNPDMFANRIIDKGVDLFIHAAATNELECAQHPYRSVYRNVSGTRAALDFCINNGIKNFLYISTFHVYGMESGTVNENTLPRPLHDYGLTHLQAEEYVRMYTRKGKLKGVSIRPSNMFDAPLSLNGFNRWSLIPFSFCKNAIDEGHIVLKTPGYQHRNFVSVKDIVRIIERIYSDEISAEIVNIPGVSSLSIREFAALVKSVMQDHFGRSIEIVAPDGESSEDKLIYESLYFSPHSLGFSNIEKHVINFCKVLMADA